MVVVVGIAVGVLGDARAATCAADITYSHYCDSSICENIGGTVYCYGSDDPDLFILFVHDSNPIIYGYVHQGDIWNEQEFCCESHDLGNITSAVDVVISTDVGDDTICLTDSNYPGCENQVDGIQVWAAAAVITTTAGDNLIVTSPDGAWDDTVTGGSAVDTVYTFGGDDTVHAGYDDDVIRGGGGLDEIWGDADNDYIDGESGNDSLVGGTGLDHLIGGDNQDTLIGSAGWDCLCSGPAGVNLNEDYDFDDLDGGEPSTGDDCYYNDGAPGYDTAINCEGAATDGSAATCGCTSP